MPAAGKKKKHISIVSFTTKGIEQRNERLLVIGTIIMQLENLLYSSQKKIKQ